MHASRVGHPEAAGGEPPLLFKWWPMIFAAFIVMLPASPARRVPDAVMWKLDWLGVAVFLALFAAALECSRRKQPTLWIVASMTGLALAFAPFNGGSTILFAYACAFAPWATAGDTRRTLAIVAAVVLVLTLEVWFAALPWRYWGITSAWCAVAAVSYLWVVKMLSALDRLAKLAERERIARDLHDVLGHTLSLVTLKAELAGQLLSEDGDIGTARREIAAIEGLSRGALSEVRQTIRGFRVESLPLEMDRVAQMLHAARIACSCDHEAVELDSARESVLSLALREAVTNVVRHARAKTCHIRVQRQADTCLLEVEDDGLGGIYAEGQGLRGMRERVEAIGGSLVLDRSRGTRLSVRVPVPS